VTRALIKAAHRLEADAIIIATIVVAVSGHPNRDQHLLERARQSALDLEASATDHLDQLLDESMTEDEIFVSQDDPLTAIVHNSQDAPVVVIGSHHSRRIDGFLAGAIAHHLPAIIPGPVALIPLAE
jgi:nucleotide-binding universal stress UspA family protein